MFYKINQFAYELCKIKRAILRNTFSILILLSFNLVLPAQDLISDAQNALPPGYNTNTSDTSLLYQTTQEFLDTEYFESVFPLELSHEGSKLLPSLSDYIDDAVFVHVNPARNQSFLQDQADYVKLNLPVGIDRTIEFALSKKEMLADNFSLKDSEGKTYPVNSDSFIHYQGVVNNSPGSMASFTILNNKVRGVISDENGNYVLGDLDGFDNLSIFYNDKNLKQQNNFSCALDEPIGGFMNKPELNGISAKIEKQRKVDGECIQIYIECDYSIYQRFDNSVPKVFDYVTALFNEVALLYANENVKIQISDIFVWTEPDPYIPFNSSHYVLDKFGEQVKNNFNGNLAHLLTTRNLGNGGLAWVDVICYPYESYNQDWDGDGYEELHHRGPYGISTVISTNVVPFSTYSWDVFVFAHELGHNLGSPHTHACAWGPSGDQALDNCFAPSGGSCGYGPAPTNGGSIMSYCNVAEYGINFSNGLGKEPGDLIRSRVNAADCLSECPCNLFLANTITIFRDYPWLSNYVQQDNCGSEVIEVYNAGSYKFIYIKKDGTGQLYYQDGTFYCSDAANATCVDNYNLSQILDSWSCGQSDTNKTNCGATGCTNPSACNYNPNATEDNGNCNFGNTNCPSPCNAIEGCTDPNANNYDPTANCDAGCDYGILNCDEEIFTTFPWVSLHVNQSNCSNQKVTVYNMLSYYFVYIETANASRLYYQDGTLYCTSSTNYNCPMLYNATQIAYTWDCALCQDCISGCNDPAADNYNPNVTCADNSSCNYPNNTCNQTNVFTEFPWLNQIVNINNCTNEKISVYDNGAYSFLYFQKDGVGGFYYQDGTYYCGDNGNYSCPASYNYSTPTGCWSCGTSTSCNQYTGTVFYDYCEDGQYYYFIRLTDGTVIDPYNAPGVDFDYPNGSTVNFNYETVNFTSPCSIVQKAVSITCIETSDISGCTDPSACNYDASATLSNGFCDYTCYSCTNNSGTVFYELCEDGQYYYFIETSQGRILDPYNADGIEYDYPNGANVNFDYVTRGTSPCSIANEAVTITCINTSNTVDVFNSYPFLNSVVNQNNCGGVTINVYDFGSYAFLSIDYGTYTELYYQDGTFYCNNCEAAYQLTSPSYTWSCAPANKRTSVKASSKLSTASSVSEVKVYPNPSNGIFNVALEGFDKIKEAELQIYNVQAQLLQTIPVKNAITEIDLKTFGSGLYWLSIQSNKNHPIQKLIVQ